MAVKSAALVSKSQLLFSRQYEHMGRHQVDGLTSAFVTMIEHQTKDKAYIETEAVRYVYQPIEKLFVVLITSKESNIVEDLGTVKLLAQIVEDVCKSGLTDEAIMDRAYDLIFAFDEVLAYGFRENVTVAQVKTYVSMESHEEKLQTMIIQSKTNEERERRHKIAAKMDKAKSKSKIPAAGPPRMGGADNHLYEYKISDVVSQTRGFSAVNYDDFAADQTYCPPKGMEIRKGQDNALFSYLSEEYAPPPAENIESPVHIRMEETLKCLIEPEGGLESIDIQGTLFYRVNNPQIGQKSWLTVTEDPRFRYKVHPFMDKSQFKDHKLVLKDDKTFPLGTPVPLLKWRNQSNDESMLPIAVSCWVSDNGNKCMGAIEVEFRGDSAPLTNVAAHFSAPPAFNLTINKCDKGDIERDSATLVWRLDTLDSSFPVATLEFSAAPNTQIMPFTLEAHSSTTICNTCLQGVHATDGTLLDCPLDVSFTASVLVGAK